MSSAKVIVREWDLSTRVPAFPGVYAGIVIPAKKGPVNEPYLVTSEAQFLKVFTPNEKVEVGYDLSYFSALTFLKHSGRLWVVRVVNDAKYGGAAVVIPNTAESSTTLSTGLSDPETYTFTSSQVLLIYGANPGAWNNDIGIKIITNTDMVKEPNAFIIQVFKKDEDGNYVQVEEYTCSRVPGAKDGYGRNIYVEDVVKSSNYIRVLDNVAIDSSQLPDEVSTVLPLGGGDDGLAVTDGDMMQGADLLANPDNLPVTLLMDGGWATAAYQLHLLSIAESRIDCVAILSTPYDVEDSSNYLNDIVDYRKTTLNANTSYGGLYTPHVKIYDKYNDRELWVSPDGFVAGIIAETARNYEIWYPPAGPRRGILDEVLDVKRRFTEGELDYLYDNGINPIRFKPGKGIAVWGQKTLSSRPSALDRLNVRLLLIVIEPAVKEALEDFLFELNDEATRSMIRAILNSYMDNIKARRGVYDYYVVCDETNNTPEDIDNNRLNVWLFVQPVKSVEYIKFTVVITRTGVSLQAAETLVGG